MNQVSCYSHSGTQTLSDTDFLARVEGLHADFSEPFAAELTDTLRLLSKNILSSEFARANPQFTALGFWLRPAAIERLKCNLLSSESTDLTAPRGVAFHLPPANVDTLFAYSWALSFLVGNSNVTRLPSNIGESTLWLLEQVNVALQVHKQDNRQIFCTFDRQSTMVAQLSRLVDLRVVWGGDEKILDVSRAPTRPDGLTIGFSDRKSICIVKSAQYNTLEPAGKLNLAEKLFNDMYWFDQMGCGSPRMLVWFGDTPPDYKTLYEDLCEIVDAKQYVTETGTEINKFVFANTMLASGVSNKAVRYGTDLTVLDSDISESLFDEIQGGGLLHQVKVSNLDLIDRLFSRQLQTVTYFGFSSDEKIELAKRMMGRGGYRVVPIGEALNFDSIWDGVDLLRHFSRVITIR